MATVQDVVNYYVAKLASIYRNKPKAASTVALFTKQMLADMLADQLNLAFDLDQAFGSQLDTIGKYVGVSRDVGTPDFKPYFGFVTGDYPAGDQNLNGFTSAASIILNASGVWLRSGMLAQNISQLTDFSYRQLIKIKITTNFSNNTMSEIQNQIQTSFPGQLQLRDNQDMSMSYFYGQSFQLPVSVLQANLPRPMGVGIEVKSAIAFDVSVDELPYYTSENPAPVVNPAAYLTAFQVTNRTPTPFTVTAITSNNGNVVISDLSSSLPITLNNGESLSFVLTNNANIEEICTLSMQVQSYAGVTQYDATVKMPAFSAIGSLKLSDTNLTAKAYIPNIAAYALSAFTIEFWINPIAFQEGYTVFGTGNTPGFEFFFHADGRLAADIGGGDFDVANTAVGQWIHVTVSRAAGSARIYRYVNGVPYANGNIASDTLSATPPSVVFGTLGGGAKGADAYYSDLRMWNVQRSDADIIATYNKRLIGTEPGLVAYYKLNEPTSVFRDSTGGNISFALVGGASFSTTVPPIIG